MTEAQESTSMPEQAQASMNEAQPEAQRYACDTWIDEKNRRTRTQDEILRKK